MSTQYQALAPETTAQGGSGTTAASFADATHASAKALALLRIATGFVFLWAFADKLFGFGYATQPANAWMNGGSPTRGFLSHVDVGPFESTLRGWAGAPWADWLFMLAWPASASRSWPASACESRPQPQP